MPSQTRAPYGDIVAVNTPYLDSAAKQLYAEQKQRQMIQYQENKGLDESMRKEFANVRSVDTPEVINSYNQYKTLKKQLLFDKNLQKDPQAYNQVQQRANEALQNTYGVINGSGELKNLSKSLLDQSIKNPDSLSDDARQKLAVLNNTPYSQARNHPQLGDLTNLDQYMYKGADVDFGKLLHEASGQPKDILGKTVPIDGGLQNQTSVYQFGNTPAQVYDYLNGTAVARKNGRSASYQWDQLPPVQIQATIDKYKQIPQDKWEKMGLPGPQDLGKFTDNKADNYNKYLAMNYAINSEPKEGKPVIKENKSAVMSAQEAKDRRMAALHHAYSESDIRLRDALKDKGENEQNDIIEGKYNEVKQDALNNPRPYKPVKGEPYSQYSIKVTEPMKQMFAVKDAKGHMIYPDDLRYSKDLKYVVPIFFEHYVNKVNGKEERLPQMIVDANGNASVDATLSKPILESEFKERWKKELLGVTGYNKSLKTNKQPSNTDWRLRAKKIE